MKFLNANLSPTIIASACVAAALTACGGGSGGNAPVNTHSAFKGTGGTSLNAEPGQTFTISGNATSPDTLLTSAKWSVTSTAGAPALTLTNQDCAVATKFDQPRLNNLASSDWTCEVSGRVPANVAANATYTFNFTATNSNGSTSASASTVSVTGKGGSLTPQATVTAPGNAATGASVDLFCAGAGGELAANSRYRYQWVVEDASGLAISLLNASTADTKFVAPAVRVPTTVRVACRVTDDSNVTGIQSASIVINPPPKPTVIADAGASVDASAGSLITVAASKSKLVDVDGKDVAGQLFYQWSQVSGPTATIVNPGSATTSIRLPAATGDAKLLFRVTVSNQAIGTAGAATGTADVEVALKETVSPPLQLSISNAAQSVASGTTVSLDASVNGAATGSTVFYSWTQISGTPVFLGGNKTAKAGFVAPTVTAPTVLVFRVSASTAAITGSNPGTSVDAVVNVTP